MNELEKAQERLKSKKIFGKLQHGKEGELRDVDIRVIGLRPVEIWMYARQKKKVALDRLKLTTFDARLLKERLEELLEDE